MRIVKPYARLMPPPHVNLANGWQSFELEHGIQLLQRVEWCARLSHRTEDKQTEDSYGRFLRTWVMEHGDFSTVEHCGISADLLVDRGLSHELVRHRLAKLEDTPFDLSVIDISVEPPEVTQESTRFVNYGKNGNSIAVVLPQELEPVEKVLGEHFDYYVSHENEAIELVADKLDWETPTQHEKLVKHWFSWRRGVEQAEMEYLHQVNLLKVAPEIARDMLPHCTATRMVMTHNLRNWRHLMIMRTTTETHRKLRPLMQDVLVELKTKVPILFDDLEPDQRQATNLRKGR